MGEVYRATDTRLKREVALKVMPEPHSDHADHEARFQREAVVLACLNHTGIAGIYALEEVDGLTALVLELVEGPTLAERIAQGPIPVGQALNIARQIAEALGAAHDAGFVHRDLKPANVKVRPDGVVKLLDFGLAKELGTTACETATEREPATRIPPSDTLPGVVLGTASYMSPEQTRGERVDQRSDIWAYGAVLFEMLTGERAFQGDDAFDTVVSVRWAEPNWRALPGDVPPGVRACLQRCLRKDPGRRPGNIRDVRLAIDREDGTREREKGRRLYKGDSRSTNPQPGTPRIARTGSTAVGGLLQAGA